MTSDLTLSRNGGNVPADAARSGRQLEESANLAKVRCAVIRGVGLVAPAHAEALGCLLEEFRVCAWCRHTWYPTFQNEAARRLSAGRPLPARHWKFSGLRGLLSEWRLDKRGCTCHMHMGLRNWVSDPGRWDVS